MLLLLPLVIAGYALMTLLGDSVRVMLPKRSFGLSLGSLLVGVGHALERLLRLNLAPLLLLFHTYYLEGIINSKKG